MIDNTIVWVIVGALIVLSTIVISGLIYYMLMEHKNRHG